MRVIRIALPALVAFYLSLPAVNAQEMLPVIKELVDRGEIRVAILQEDQPPMIISDKKGNLSGFDISLARVIGRELGTKVSFVRVKSFNDVIEEVANKTADIGVSLLSRTPARAKFVRFSRAYIRQNVTVLLNRVRGLRFRQTCPTFAQLLELTKTPKMVGVIRDSAYENSANSRIKGHKLVLFDAFDDMMKAVSSGKLMMTVQGEVAARYYLHTNPIGYIRLKLCEFDDHPDAIGIAVRPDAPDLVEWLNVLLERYNIRFDAEVILDKDPEKIIP